MIHYRQPEQAVTGGQLRHLLPVGVGADGDRAAGHSVVQGHPRAGEHQIPKRNHPHQVASMIHHVHVGQVLDLVVQLAQPFDGFPGGNAGGKHRQVGDHQAPRRVGGVREQSRQFAGHLRFQLAQQAFPPLRAQFAQQVGRHVGVHGSDYFRRPFLLHPVQQSRPPLGPHFVQQPGGYFAVQIVQQDGGRLRVQLLQNVGGVVRVGGRQRPPLFRMGMEVFPHRARFHPGRPPQSLGELARAQQAHPHCPPPVSPRRAEPPAPGR